MATKNSTANAANSLDGATFGDVEGGKKVLGGFHPAWVPHYSEFKGKDFADRMAKLPEGSTSRKDLRGTLVEELAFKGGKNERKLYHLDVPVGKDSIRVRLPEHGSLWNALAFVPKVGDVKLVWGGRGVARKGRRAPHLYDVTCANALKEARADALVLAHDDDDEASS
jgi:hypothetical protein